MLYFPIANLFNCNTENNVISYLHHIIYKKNYLKELLKKSRPCSADCQLQPPVCQESGRSPAVPPVQYH